MLPQKNYDVSTIERKLILIVKLWLSQVNKTILVASIFLLIALIVGFFGFQYTHVPADRTIPSALNDFYANFVSELFGIAITVLIIDTLTKFEQRKSQLIHELGSRSSQVASYALQMLTELGWLYSGLLRGANLEKANLEHSQMAKANMEGANLCYSNLKEVSLKDADLEMALLDNADLEGADLRCCDLRSASLKNSSMKRTILNKAKLTDTSFQQTDLSGARMSSVEAPNASFQAAILADVRLVNADLTHANFENADLRNADLSFAQLAGANLKGANLLGAQLKGIGLESHMEISMPLGPSFHIGPIEFILAEVVTKITRYSGITYDDQTVWPLGFRPPLLRSSRLSVESFRVAGPTLRSDLRDSTLFEAKISKRQ